MISPFGIDHGISKALKPQHLQALQRVAQGGGGVQGRPQVIYSRARLKLHGMQGNAATISKPKRQLRTQMASARSQVSERKAHGVWRAHDERGFAINQRKKPLP